MRIVFVHGACVKDGSWWWHRTAELLAECGLASEAPALPSCGETGAPVDAGGPGLTEDGAAVRSALSASDEPAVVVAHSYGGVVAAEAAAGVEAVRHLLLVSSYLPEPGESLSSLGGGARAIPRHRPGGRDLHRQDPNALAGTFLQDCDEEIQQGSLGKTAHPSLAVLEQPVRSAAWQHVPSTYLVCTEDRGTPAARQREFAPAGGHRRGTRSRPPPVPLPAGRSARSHSRPVRVSRSALC